MKKLVSFCVLIMAFTFSTFAFSDAISVTATTVENENIEEHIIHSGSNNYISFRLHIEGYGLGSFAASQIRLDYGIVHSLSKFNTVQDPYNMSLSRSYHNGGSDINMLVIADLSFDNTQALASIQIWW